MSAAARATALLRSWQARPEIARLLAALDTCRGDDAAGALAAIDRLFADTRWVTGTLAMLVAAVRNDRPLPFPALGGGDALQEGLLLVDHPLAMISLAVVPRLVLAQRKREGGGEGTIGFSGAITRYRVLKSGGARLGWWRCERIDAGFDAATAPPCRRTGSRALLDGDWILVDGAEEGFIVEAADSDLVFLQATLAAGRAPLHVSFDAVTRQYVSASATDPAASHRQMIATLLRVLGRRDAAPALASMAADDAFFVRWHAARELAALDPAAALPVLDRLARDPRADVAAAAEVALGRLRPCPA